MTLCAAPPLTEALIASFEDERGHRRASDRPFLRHRLGLADDQVETTHSPINVDSPDIRLWRGTHSHSAAAEDALNPPGPGPLLRWEARPGLEVWTESELSGLHALWWLGTLHARPDLLDRCFAAAFWHVDNLQPDNATNHPWALHVFVLLAARSTDPDASAAAGLHAQTLLHNCMVSLGRPDLLSAHILADAADALERPR